MSNLVRLGWSQPDVHVKPLKWHFNTTYVRAFVRQKKLYRHVSLTP